MQRALAIFTVMGLLCAPEVSSAQDAGGHYVHADDSAWEKHFAVLGIVGFGTPVGYAGLAVEYSPTPILALGVGAGLGSGTENTDCLASGHVGVCEGPLADRVQLAAMGRLRLLREQGGAVTIGGGFSTGGYSWDEFTTDAPAHKSAERAYWVNMELGGEFRGATGFSARGFAGYGRMLNPGALECVESGVNTGHCDEDHQGDGEGVVYFGGGFGWAF
ncbi:MAG: hypothetical protein R3B13_20950 [Polyangiaceae bacterium]